MGTTHEYSLASALPTGKYQFTPGQVVPLYPQLADTLPLVLSKVGEGWAGGGLAAGQMLLGDTG
jgi:hypothetical protein